MHATWLGLYPPLLHITWWIVDTSSMTDLRWVRDLLHWKIKVQVLFINVNILMKILSQILANPYHFIHTHLCLSMAKQSHVWWVHAYVCIWSFKCVFKHMHCSTMCILYPSAYVHVYSDGHVCVCAPCPCACVCALTSMHVYKYLHVCVCFSMHVCSRHLLSGHLFFKKCLELFFKFL